MLIMIFFLGVVMLMEMVMLIGMVMLIEMVMLMEMVMIMISLECLQNRALGSSFEEERQHLMRLRNSLFKDENTQISRGV